MLPLTFSNFIDSNNPSILWSLKFKISASKSCCFCILLLPNLWKIAQQFKILANLYFYRFLIIFNLALQQVLLVIELTKVEIFIRKCLFSLFHLHLKIYNKISLWRKSIRLFWSASSIYFFREVLQIESIVLLYFKGN